MSTPSSQIQVELGRDRDKEHRQAQMLHVAWHSRCVVTGNIACRSMLAQSIQPTAGIRLVGTEQVSYFGRRNMTSLARASQWTIGLLAVGHIKIEGPQLCVPYE